MSNCRHEDGYTTRQYNLPDAGNVCIVICSTCQTAIGVVPNEFEKELRNIKSTLSQIQSIVSQLK